MRCACALLTSESAVGSEACPPHTCTRPLYQNEIAAASGVGSEATVLSDRILRSVTISTSDRIPRLPSPPQVEKKKNTHSLNRPLPLQTKSAGGCLRLGGCLTNYESHCLDTRGLARRLSRLVAFEHGLVCGDEAIVADQPPASVGAHPRPVLNHCGFGALRSPRPLRGHQRKY